MKRRRNVVPVLYAAVPSIGLALLAAEASLRCTGCPQPARAGWRTFYQPYEGLEQANQLRFRGRPFAYEDDDYVIVLVGDSQVEARACSFEWMPECRLEHHLAGAVRRPVKVFSIGVSGYGQDQELLALREYLAERRADHVVAWLSLTNDFKDNTWPTFMPIDGRRKPTFWLQDGELHGPNCSAGILSTSRFRLVELFRQWRQRSPDARWEEEHLPPPYRFAGEPDDRVRHDWQELCDKGMMNREAMRREKCDRALQLTPRSERTRYAIELTNRLLHEMADEAREHGAAFTLFAVDKGDRGEEIDGVYDVDGAYYRASSEQYWRNVSEITAGFDLELIAFEEPRWKTGPLDHHLNEHATDEVMHELANRLAGGL